MAVNEKQDLVRDFWPGYKRRSILFIIVLQLAIAVVIIAALVAMQTIVLSDLTSILHIIAIVVITIAVNIFGFHLLTKPLRSVIDAMLYVTGDPTVKRQDPEHAGSLKPILSAIYDLSNEKNQPTTPAVIDEKTTATELPGVDDAPVGMAFFSDSGQLIYANKSAPLSQNEPSKINLLFQTDETIEDWMKQCRENAVHAQKTWTRIPSKPLGESERKVFNIIANYDKGNESAFSIVFIDRTKEYIPEDEELNFIAFAAHELRGPITVIRGYLDTLSDELNGVIDTEQQELFDRLMVSSNRLANYINNILNSSKYDRRHLNVRLVETRLSDVYQSIADDMELRAKSQERVLVVDLPADLPTVAADAASLSEVFSNLIDNAIKYSNHGGLVKVSAEIHESKVEVEVEDHGIGMPANVVSNLFHKFYRSHRSRETVAGTGIGLYISKAIIESHGGTMNVRSVEGEGSVFTFSLPVYASVAKKLAETDGDNRLMISNHSGSWIKNHGTIRG